LSDLIAVKMKIRTHKELEAYKLAFDCSMKIFEISKRFPKEETYSLTDQIRRSSRSVCGNLAEAFRKRRYPKAFISKLSDSEGESAETQTWLDFANSCKYITIDEHKELYAAYENIIGKLVIMSIHPENWSW
jgi:four helix bundle protein